MHPVGPRSSRVYWFRRVLVALVALAVVVGVGWSVIGRRSGSAIDPAAAGVSTGTTPPLTGVLASDTTGDTMGGTVATPADSTSTSPGAATTGTTATATTSATAAPATGTTATGTTRTTAATSTATTATTGTTAAKTAAAATTPETTAPKTTAPRTTAPPKPSYDANGTLICPDSDIAVKAFTQGGPTFPAGSQPRLGMSVTNVGTASCVRDLAGAIQVYTVYTAAGKRVWSTADCFPGEGHEVRLLAPGSSVSFVIIWSGTTSAPGCTAPRVRVQPGAYALTARLGTLAGKPVPFTMR